MKTWAQRIEELEAAGWSLTEIGKHIDLSPQAVSDIKCGRSKEPRGMAAVNLHAMEATSPPAPQTAAQSAALPKPSKRAA